MELPGKDAPEWDDVRAAARAGVRQGIDLEAQDNLTMVRHIDEVAVSLRADQVPREGLLAPCRTRDRIEKVWAQQPCPPLFRELGPGMRLEDVLGEHYPPELAHAARAEGAHDGPHRVGEVTPL